MKIKREQEVELTTSEKLRAAWDLKNKNSKILEIILNTDRLGCPFPDACEIFPCQELHCNADVCSNGHAFRYS